MTLNILYLPFTVELTDWETPPTTNGGQVCHRRDWIIRKGDFRFMRTIAGSISDCEIPGMSTRKLSAAIGPTGEDLEIRTAPLTETIDAIKALIDKRLTECIEKHRVKPQTSLPPILPIVTTENRTLNTENNERSEQ